MDALTGGGGTMFVLAIEAATVLGGGHEACKGTGISPGKKH